MDVVWLSRLQFAVATMFHFIFVPLSLGLSILVAIMETQYVRTGDEEYKRMAKFWGKIFLVNFAVGVVTGLTLEFQFGTNWARYSKTVGDVFGPLLAIEATVAFFMESTFIAVWVFGWNRLSPKVHLLSIWLVCLAAGLSAFWILTANAWMQHPVGHVMVDGKASMDNFWAVISQKMAIHSFLHALFAGYLVGGFFVMGISAYHLLKGRNVSFFRKSFNIALVFSLIFSIAEIGIGDLHGKEVGRTQHEKLAAMESVWETEKGVPFAMFVIPDEANERNLIEFGRIPKFMSWLVYGDWNAEVKGLKDWPKEDRPPVTLVFSAFRIMVGLGFLFALITVTGMLLRKNLENHRRFLWLLVCAIPLPFIAAELGWIVTEVGRQPWIVYGLMRTTDAVSPIPASSVAISLTAFIVLYTFLGVTAYSIIMKIALSGPETTSAGANGK